MAIFLTTGLASVMGDIRLDYDASGAASLMGPRLCPPDTEPFVVKVFERDKNGERKQDGDYELHCKTQHTGVVKASHGLVFRMLWGARFIPEASMGVVASGAAYLVARLIRRGFSRLKQAFSRPSSATNTASPPPKQPRRKRRR
jgi:hypothetical protein